MKVKFLFLLLLASTVAQAQTPNLSIDPVTTQKLHRIVNIPTPKGFQRTQESANSFGHYLRQTPLKADKTVYLYNGATKGNQSAQYAVLNIDVGKRDLQQCADAIMRLRAEYLYAQKRYTDIHFNFVNGMRVNFTDYAQGNRMQVKGNKTKWIKKAQPNNNYKTFRRYLTLIYSYAGTASLAKELLSVSSIQNIQIGDVFIIGGHPGHGIIVVDKATDALKRPIFMLAQSYMPAQDIHVLNNPANKNSPWYYLQDGETLYTPEYVFSSQDLKRFAEK